MLIRERKREIARKVEIPASTFWKNKKGLQVNHTLGGKGKKCTREPSCLDVDTAIFQWFNAVRAQGVPISGEVLRPKAEELDPSEEWTCSNGRLSRWKARHDIE